MNLLSRRSDSISALPFVLWIGLLSAQDLGNGVELYRQQQFEAAEQAFRQALARNPNDSAARLYLSRTLIERQRIPDALAELDRLVAGSTDPEVRFQAGRILRELAESRFSELERVAGNSAPVRELAGRRSDMKGDFAEALREYRAAAALDPKRPGVHYLIGNILWKMRELEAAADELRVELAASPHHAMANLRLGQVLLAQNNPSAALPHLVRASGAMPESTEARRELGKAYRQSGRLMDAKREWEAVAKASPQDDQIFYLLGNLYRDLGETVRAKEALAKHRAILERRRALAERR